MSQLTNMETPLAIAFSNGDWDVIRGLLCGEWRENEVKAMCAECLFVRGVTGNDEEKCVECKRRNPAYAATCERIMRQIDHAKGRK